MGGEPLVTFHVERQATASTVKSMVEQELGYPPEAQQLLRQGGGALEEEEKAEAPLDLCPGPLALTLVLLPFDKAQALLAAAENGHAAAVRSLLARAADLGEEELPLLLAAKDPVRQGQTALHAAASQGHVSVCEALLGAAQSVEELVGLLAATDRLGFTALHRAIEPVGASIARPPLDPSVAAATCLALLAAAPSEVLRDAMLRAKTYTDRDTALLLAARWDPGKSCRMLLEAAPTEELRREMLLARNRSGFTPLHAAAAWGCRRACRALLDAATAEVRCEMLAATAGSEGRTPADVADRAARGVFDSA